jgi:hypothetical protein
MSLTVELWVETLADSMMSIKIKVVPYDGPYPHPAPA